MSEAALPFEPKGVMAMRDACLVIFRGLTPGEWLSKDELVARVCELTEYEHEAGSVTGAAWSAAEVMAVECEGSVRVHMGGYQRLDAAGKVAVVDARLRGLRNGIARMITRVGDAIADPELPSAQRQRMQEVARAEQWQRELEARRKRRRRPLPPGGTE